MKSISRDSINLGFSFVLLFGITFVAGFFYWIWFIFSGIFLLSYIILDKKKLRCPECGGFENLDRLMYAKNHVYHCKQCGERLIISYYSK
jgi:DNA-directed RNA polymerase subunit RPC12/RpoP